MATFRDNEYILSGYRPISHSYQRSGRSIIKIHNETVNIWSHLIGAALFFGLPIPVYRELSPRYQSASTADILVFSTFFFGVAICFLLSATFHIVNNHSEHINIIGNQLDYLGIVILMWGSTIPCVYYGFFCDPTLQYMYWGMVTIFAAACTYATLRSTFRTPQYRPYRTAMYACLGLSFIIPIIHSIILYGWETQMWRMSLDWMALMAMLNLSGAALYAFRIPEKLFPRRFDILGASHQIMHCMVIFAGFAHLCGLLRAFDHLHAQNEPCRKL
ncbi:Hly-III related protein [Aulographum hederae CBS 113979]|uniref:Hly-III related protein n=1 Tax=Aulographum hederae CBS 113979 TaxID=1176131 RepID=A0A6G1HH84_9PEZI|nr:Hly-III related protein [Aulographum hederae CBS 113979]